MSKAYRDFVQVELVPTTDAEMRAWCKRPGEERDGLPLYMTEQNHLKECDINEIVKKYDRDGLIEHVAALEARWGDARAVDFKRAMDLLTGANQQFEKLPGDIRKRFNNNVGELLDFMDNPENRAEALKLGLIAEYGAPVGAVGVKPKEVETKVNES